MLAFIVYIWEQICYKPVSTTDCKTKGFRSEPFNYEERQVNCQLPKLMKTLTNVFINSLNSSPVSTNNAFINPVMSKCMWSSRFHILYIPQKLKGKIKKRAYSKQYQVCAGEIDIAIKKNWTLDQDKLYAWRIEWMCWWIPIALQAIYSVCRVHMTKCFIWTLSPSSLSGLNVLAVQCIVKVKVLL